HEFDHGFARLCDLIGHTAAHVKDYTQRKRSVFAGEMSYLLQLVALENGEILFVQPGHDAVPVVGDRYVDQDQVDVHCNRLAMVHFEARVRGYPGHLCGWIYWWRNAGRVRSGSGLRLYRDINILGPG